MAYPIDPMAIRKLTKSDSTLCKVSTWIQTGWPNSKPTEADLHHFWTHRESLLLHDNILLLQQDTNSRVVNPKSLRNDVLEILHSSHWGVVKVKQLARRYVWWPSLNADIEKLIQSCEICKQCSSAPQQFYTEWPKTDSPWERLHLDFAGPFQGKMWLMCVDAHSKFPYVGMMNLGQTTTQQTISVLKDIFSLEGLPTTVVTDNGPQFVSKEFEAFCSAYDIQHITSSPYHPPSNGEAERFVQTFKKAVEKNCVGGMQLKDSVRLALATYRCLPHPSIDWKTPAEILHGRQPKSLLSILNPQTNATSPIASSNDTKISNDTKRTSQLAVDSLVYARNFATGAKWLPGIVVAKLGTTVFMVKTDRGIWKRHANQLQIRIAKTNEHNDSSAPQVDNFVLPTPATQSDNPTDRRYPLRIRKAPERYQP